MPDPLGVQYLSSSGPSPLSSTHRSPQSSLVVLSASPSQARAPRQPCVSLTCQQASSRGGHRNSQCVSQYCKTCCQQTVRHCPAPKHNEPPAPAVNSVTVT